MDGSLFTTLNRFADRTSWAHGFMRFNAENGIVLFGVLLVVAYLDARLRADHAGIAGAVWAGAAAIVALGVGQLIGNAVDRARPYATLPDVHLLVSKTSDFSFPSDHATVAGAVAVGLLLTSRRWIGVVAAGAALFMAFTRVYVGAHYPLDVLAGLALGGGIAGLGAWLLVPRLTHLVDRLSDTRLEPLFGRRPDARPAAQAV